MAIVDIRRHQIAAGHNNEAGLKFFTEFSDCLFRGYGPYIPFEWHDYESREMGADRRLNKIGLPYYVLLMPMVTEEDYEYLVDTFCTNRLDGLVTFVGFDRTARQWKTFNATLELPDQIEYDQEQGFYPDVRLTFRELVEI